ncbi:PhzF family phenazine biosynthesis isomerase [Acidothermaceae bacterium B102]|nr:PhzF family phenazine biosynthesis isomerase [Acidothermaceae bacterium B102]
MADVLRYAAFTTDPAGGNPAGVVLDATGLDAPAMQALAAEVGYSETAFVTEAAEGSYDVRYFAPTSEVPFCGHATIATAVALADRGSADHLLFHTQAGDIAVTTSIVDGHSTATLTSVTPYVELVEDETVEVVLAALGWSLSDLDDALPPLTAFAGARHLVLAVSTRERLADLHYDFDGLLAVMTSHRWTTVQLVWREDETTHHVRDPFPVGGVVEDPATGAAAAAYGAYLRSLGVLHLPATLTLHQGDDLGRPSVLLVDVPAGDGGISVTGAAVAMA